jgi:hypothetical protein
VADRPAFFQSALTHVRELRFKTGRPHWIVVDEAHHVLPKDLASAGIAVPTDLQNFVFVTVHPDLVSPTILKSVDELIAVGPEPQAVISQLYKTAKNHLLLKSMPAREIKPDYTLVWPFSDPAGPRYVKVEPGKSQRRRHRRKYAAGELGEDKSFYFRGAQGQLNLRAQNMNLFTQMAEGVDEETWTFHLSQGDYSRWLRDSIKDEDIALLVAGIEKNLSLSSSEGRQQIIDAIRKHYTAPA